MEDLWICVAARLGGQDPPLFLGLTSEIKRDHSHRVGYDVIRAGSSAGMGMGHDV
jgi:hypothetical protein